MCINTDPKKKKYIYIFTTHSKTLFFSKELSEFVCCVYTLKNTKSACLVPDWRKSQRGERDGTLSFHLVISVTLTNR